MHENPRLAELARRYGVGVEYWNWTGSHVRVSDETLAAVLGALDVDASTDEAVDDALERADELEWRRAVPPSVVVREGASPRVAVHAPHGSPVTLAAVLESGETVALEPADAPIEQREIDGETIDRTVFAVPETLPKGWHELRATIAGAPAGACALIVTPARGSGLGDREWGLMAQLYQVRSAGSWGLGDLADARALAEWAASEGAGFLLLNPLHAPAPVAPIEPSPYLPTTRRFVDPSVLRVDELDAFDRLTGEAATRVADVAATAREANGDDAIDRDAVWAAKRAALEACFDVDLESPERRGGFDAFCRREGQGLVDFATYCALAERHGRDWGAWPEGLRGPSSAEVAAFREAERRSIDFFRWLQWVIDEQLARLQQAAREAGMRIGLVHDLAVGVHPQGADTWALPDSIARGVSVGVPPDPFNQLGQNWSQPPWRPDRLAESGYAPYRDMLRTILRHAGGVRIDHILGLFRLWWIPDGNSADDGAYVRYDYEAMLGVLLLEAERAGAVVIGEDLGVVEDLTRTTMAERGVAGTSILWWEWDDERPLGPEQYRESCLAAVTTHDMPPTAGYLELEHVRLRERLGLLTRSVDEEREAETAAIDRVVARLEADGLVAPGASVDERVLALHRYLAGSRAALLGVAVADLAGDRRSINLPGTYQQYPNWSLPIAGPDGAPCPLESLIASPFAAEVAAASHRRHPGD